MAEKPKVYITADALRLLHLYIDEAAGEISGLGVVELVGGQACITDILLLEQECTGSTTDLDENGVHKFLVDWIQADKDPNTLKLWWHSHAQMSCFWSGTDTDTIKKFENQWMLSVVGNKKGEFKCRLDMYEPLLVGIEDIQLIEIRDPDDELRAMVKAEIATKVKSKTYQSGNDRWKNKRWITGQGWVDIDELEKGKGEKGANKDRKPKTQGQYENKAGKNERKDGKFDEDELEALYGETWRKQWGC